MTAESGIPTTARTTGGKPQIFRSHNSITSVSTWTGLTMCTAGCRITAPGWESPSIPADPDYRYAEAQGGEIGRVNRKTHEIRNIKPLPHYKEGKLRFNWNTPIHVSPTEKGTIYIGAQFLFGLTWI